MKLCIDCGEPANGTRCSVCQKNSAYAKARKKKRQAYQTMQYNQISPYGTCACCGTSGKMTRDHIVPLSQGGPNTPGNIQLLCLPCNSSKADTDACRLDHR